MQVRREDQTLGDRQGVIVWEDVATVTVPARTKRRTIAEKAFADARDPSVFGDPGDYVTLRVLDAASSEYISGPLVQPAPTLELG